MIRLRTHDTADACVLVIKLGERMQTDDVTDGRSLSVMLCKGLNPKRPNPCF